MNIMQYVGSSDLLQVNRIDNSLEYKCFSILIFLPQKFTRNDTMIIRLISKKNLQSELCRFWLVGWPSELYRKA